MIGWTTAQWAQRVDRALGAARVVNLGAGLPATLVDHLDTSARYYHCENGLVGMGPTPPPAQATIELPNANSQAVSLVPGAAALPIDLSFGLIRAGHIEASVLGAYQVGVNGDFANWSAPFSLVPGVGGAMDIAAGVPRIVLMMRHLSRDGSPRLVRQLDLPATGWGCVEFVVTEYALIQIHQGAFWVLDKPAGVQPEELVDATAAPVVFATPQTAGQARRPDDTDNPISTTMKESDDA
jgi:3-oxoacid CoA-transferase subunit B